MEGSLLRGVECVVKGVVRYWDVFSWLVLLMYGDVRIVDNDIISVDAGDNEPVVDIFVVDWLKVEED